MVRPCVRRASFLGSSFEFTLGFLCPLPKSDILPPPALLSESPSESACLRGPHALQCAAPCARYSTVLPRAGAGVFDTA